MSHDPYTAVISGRCLRANMNLSMFALQTRPLAARLLSGTCCLRFKTHLAGWLSCLAIDLSRNNKSSGSVIAGGSPAIPYGIRCHCDMGSRIKPGAGSIGGRVLRVKPNNCHVSLAAGSLVSKLSCGGHCEGNETSKTKTVQTRSNPGVKFAY